jgi:hypothetical protein
MLNMFNLKRLLWFILIVISFSYDLLQHNNRFAVIRNNCKYLTVVSVLYILAGDHYDGNLAAIDYSFGKTTE